MQLFFDEDSLVNAGVKALTCIAIRTHLIGQITSVHSVVCIVIRSLPGVNQVHTVSLQPWEICLTEVWHRRSHFLQVSYCVAREKSMYKPFPNLCFHSNLASNFYNSCSFFIAVVLNCSLLLMDRPCIPNRIKTGFTSCLTLINVYMYMWQKCACYKCVEY